jgi:hypothetical protein
MGSVAVMWVGKAIPVRDRHYGYLRPGPLRAYLLHQRLKLLGDLDVQLDDTLVGFRSPRSLARIARPRYSSVWSRIASSLALGSIIMARSVVC